MRQLRSDLETIIDVYDKLQLEYSGNDAPSSTTRIQESLEILAALTSIQEKFDDLYTKLK